MRLSICIPTHNRSQLLGDLLASICAADHHEQVNVVISDNASVDDTESRVATYSRRLRVIYGKNPLNIGADRNYIKAAELATGDFIWFMGSDDLVAPRGIRLILDSIGSLNASVILGNRNNFNRSGIFTQTNWFGGMRGIIPLRSDVDWIDYLDRLGSIGGLFSYLSSIIVQRELWIRHVSTANAMFDTAYAHVSPLVCGLLDCKHIGIIPNSVVNNRTGNDSFSNRSLIKRVNLDLVGYLNLYDRHFCHMGPGVRDAFMRLLARETASYVGMAKSKLMYFANSESTDIAMYLNLRRRIGIPDRAMSAIDYFSYIKPLLRMLIALRGRRT